MLYEVITNLLLLLLLGRQLLERTAILIRIDLDELAIV